MPHSKTVKVTSVGDIVAETIQCISDVAPLGSITESHFEKIGFNINLKGLLFTVQKALPLFQDAGSIILTASADLIAATLDSKCYVRLETLSIILATKGKIKADNPGNFFEHCRNRSCLNNIILKNIHTYVQL